MTRNEIIINIDTPFQAELASTFGDGEFRVGDRAIYNQAQGRYWHLAQDARFMAGRGYTVNEIADELGVDADDVRLMLEAV